MAASFLSYVGDGVTTDFGVPPYIDSTHIGVTVGGTPVTFTFFSTSVARLAVAPIASAVVVIQRLTPKTPIVDFVDGAVLVESDLDTSSLQAIYIAEEAWDNTGGDISGEAAAASASATSAATSAAAALVSETNAAASEAATADKLPLTGGIMTGDITLKGNGTSSLHPVSVQQIATKADLSSPALTGNPTAPTQTAGDNSTNLATTAYADGVASRVWTFVEDTYDFAVDGVLASVETATFVDGYEYRLDLIEVSHNGGGSERISVDLFFATAAAYDANSIKSSVTHNAGALWNGHVFLGDVRESIKIHSIFGVADIETVAIFATLIGTLHNATAQKIDKARISFASSLDAGVIKLYRRAL